MRPNFKGLTEVEGLSDAQLRDLVLGSWPKLNRVLMTRPSARAIQRLLALEWYARRGSRADILVRLRVALNRARGREALAALREAARLRDEGAKVSGELVGRALR